MTAREELEEEEGGGGGLESDENLET